MKKHSRPILVTGATGFIGSWVVAKLIKASRHVAALDQNPNTSLLRQVLQDEDYASIDFYSCVSIIISILNSLGLFLAFLIES